MKVTKFGQNQGLVSNASSSGTASGIGGVQVIGGAQPGQAIISSGSNSSISSNSATWQPVVSTISANGSNILLGPHVNLASGSNVVFSVSSNTLFIHSTGGGSASGNFVTVIDGGGESVYAHGALGTTETIDLSLGNYHTGTLNANCTFTFTVTAGVAHRWFTLELLEDGTGGWTPTFPGSVIRIDGSPAHDTTAGTTTIYVFWTINGGTTWKGGVLGGGPSLGSTSTDVTNTSAAGAGTTASPVTHTHTGVVLVTSNSSNSLLRPIANFASGSGIRHSISSNTLTISTELTSPVMEAAPHWELVMQDGVTAPPEPVENEARDDWLYGLVT